VMLCAMPFNCRKVCLHRVLVSTAGVALVIYAALMVLTNPHLQESSCKDFNRAPHLSLVNFFVGWAQHTSTVLVVAMQLARAAEKSDERWRSLWSPWRAAGVAALCVALAIVPSLVTIPPLVLQICRVVKPQAGFVRLVPNAVWTYVVFMTMLGIGVCYSCQEHRNVAALDSALPEHAEAEEESSPSSQLTGSDTASDSAGDDAKVNVDRHFVPTWRAVARGMIFFQVVRVFVRVINTAHVFVNDHVTGGFAQMLVVESIMEQAQLPVLIGLMLADEALPREIARGLRRIPFLGNCFCCGAKDQRRKTVLDPTSLLHDGDGGSDHGDEGVGDLAAFQSMVRKATTEGSLVAPRMSVASSANF